jgi:hypothetical protein
MNTISKEMFQLRNYIGASPELTGWITGAKAFALRKGAVDSGHIKP